MPMKTKIAFLYSIFALWLLWADSVSAESVRITETFSNDSIILQHKWGNSRRINFGTYISDIGATIPRPQFSSISDDGRGRLVIPSLISSSGASNIFASMLYRPQRSPNPTLTTRQAEVLFYIPANAYSNFNHMGAFPSFETQAPFRRVGAVAFKNSLSVQISDSSCS